MGRYQVINKTSNQILISMITEIWLMIIVEIPTLKNIFKDTIYLPVDIPILAQFCF